MQITRPLDLPPDPIAVARRLADRPGLAVLWDATPGGCSYAACDPVATSEALDPEPAWAVSTGAWGESREDIIAQQVPRWIGILPYEAMRDLERPTHGRHPETRPDPLVVRPLWARYGAVARITDHVRVVGDDAEASEHLVELLRRSPHPRTSRLSLAEPLEAGATHVARIRAALELIKQGQLYQVNLARRFRLRVQGDLVDLLATLGRRAPSPWCAALRLGDTEVLSTSPELFLRLDRTGRILTAPIKGTRPRGRTPEEDRALALELDADPKERAELAMVVDVERNDLGRIAETGSVKVIDSPTVVTHETVHHRVATVEARLLPDVGRQQLLRAMLPSGSITGAPKIRAMEVIGQLEAHRRGLYTGAIGSLAQDGTLTLSMAIRCLSIREGEGHYFAGGGIVSDSSPEREVEETRWKALQLGLEL